jgi:hypothetical protein
MLLRFALALSLVCIALIGTGCGESGTSDTSGSGSASAGASTEIDRDAITAEISDAQGEFWAAGNRYMRTRYRCDGKEDDAAMVKCDLARQNVRAQHEAIEDGRSAMSDVPMALDQLSAGAGSSCTDAIGIWADDADSWMARVRRWDLTIRREDYPETGKSKAESLAARAYYRALVSGDPKREEVNRLAVLYACTPESASRNAYGDIATFVDDFYTAYYSIRFEDAKSSVCFADVGGSYYDGFESETTVKTCVALASRSERIAAAVKAMNSSFQALRKLPDWATQTPVCARAVSKVVSVTRSDARATIRLHRLDSSNGSRSERNAAMDAFDSIDYDGRYRSMRKQMDCLRQLADESEVT